MCQRCALEKVQIDRGVGEAALHSKIALDDDQAAGCSLCRGFLVEVAIHIVETADHSGGHGVLETAIHQYDRCVGDDIHNSHVVGEGAIRAGGHGTVEMAFRTVVAVECDSGGLGLAATIIHGVLDGAVRNWGHGSALRVFHSPSRDYCVH